jgi:peptidoglycan/LPS O-acetylase OafA/YrhL
MYYPVIDFYRFFASLIVCCGHILYVITNLEIFEFLSIVGVELFFVLSGFVLAPQLMLLEKNPFEHLKVFLFRRWLRTLPAYFIALTCAAILFGYGTKLNLLQFFSYTQNFFIDKPFLNFYPVAWSLSVEEWFYIYIPILLIVFSLVKLNRKNKIIT